MAHATTGGRSECCPLIRRPVTRRAGIVLPRRVRVCVMVGVIVSRTHQDTHCELPCGLVSCELLETDLVTKWFQFRIA